MRIELSPADLEPLVEAVVEKTIARLESLQRRGDRRLAYTEPEAAATLGGHPHVLRDARLRGEIIAVKMGKRWLYSHEELVFSDNAAVSRLNEVA